MFDEMMKVLGSVGINPFTAMLLAIIFWFVRNGIKSIISQNDHQSGKLTKIDTTVQLVQQELRMHAEEDTRRFEGVHEHIRGSQALSRREDKT